MKKTAAMTALGLLAWSGSALSAGGLGISIQSGDPTIYVPFDINDKFRVEPYLTYSHSEFETRVFDSTSPYTVHSVDEVTRLSLGAGFFYLAPFGESVRAYFGARASYVSIEYDYSYDNGSRPPGFPAAPDDAKGDGLTFEPTIGLEYRFTERFSIAGEAKLVVGSVDFDDDSSQDTTFTDTNVVARFRF